VHDVNLHLSAWSESQVAQYKFTKNSSVLKKSQVDRNTGLLKSQKGKWFQNGNHKEDAKW
jgi:hypothetical protein